MTPLPHLTELSSEAKEALIAEVWEKVQALEQQLEARSKVLKKTAKNSSLAPSQGFKPNVKPMQTAGETRQASVGQAGGGRELHPNPDQTIVARLK